jgi:hypothetical protein
MFISLYIVVVVDKESRYYNKVDAKRENSSRKKSKKLEIESSTPIDTFTTIMTKKILRIHNFKTVLTNFKR